MPVVEIFILVLRRAIYKIRLQKIHMDYPGERDEIIDSMGLYKTNCFVCKFCFKHIQNTYMINGKFIIC